MASSQTRREREDNVCEASERWDQSPICFNSILMEPTIIAHICKYSISFLSMQMKNGVNTRQLYALPPGRRRAAAALAARQPTLPRPHYPESGQARVHSSEQTLASLERPLRLQSRQLGSSPLSTFTPGDFRSYCHAPARLWPPKLSTDSLDLTRNRPALGARLFQTGVLPTHRCLDKPGKRGKRSRDCAGSIPPSLPREVQ